MGLFGGNKKKKDSLSRSLDSYMEREERRERLARQKRERAARQEATRQKKLTTLRKKTEVARAEGDYYGAVNRKRRARAAGVRSFFGKGSGSTFGKVKKRKKKRSYDW